MSTFFVTVTLTVDASDRHEAYGQVAEFLEKSLEPVEFVTACDIDTVQEYDPAGDIDPLYAFVPCMPDGTQKKEDEKEMLYFSDLDKGANGILLLTELKVGESVILYDGVAQCDHVTRIQ